MSRIDAINLPSALDLDSIRKAFIDFQAKVNDAMGGGSSSGSVSYDLSNGDATQSASDTNAGLIKIIGAIGKNRTVKLYRASADKLYSILVPAATLKASAGGPFSVTLTTGVSGKSNIIIPISPSADTISSGNLLFDINIDSAGNISSKAWSIAGSNSNGSYVKFADGTMECWMVPSGFIPYNTWTTYSLPAAFIDTTYSGSMNLVGDVGSTGLFNLKSTTQFSAYNRSASGTAVGGAFMFMGRWR